MTDSRSPTSRIDAVRIAHEWLDNADKRDQVKVMLAYHIGTQTAGLLDEGVVMARYILSESGMTKLERESAEAVERTFSSERVAETVTRQTGTVTGGRDPDSSSDKCETPRTDEWRERLAFSIRDGAILTGEQCAELLSLLPERDAIIIEDGGITQALVATARETTIEECAKAVEAAQCLPACDRYAHEELCPVVFPEAAIRALKSSSCEGETR